jgi:hypothetical protein
MEEAEKPLKELFSEAIAKRKAREEDLRRKRELQVAHWVPDAVVSAVLDARRTAKHGGGFCRVVGLGIPDVPPAEAQQLWAKLLDQLAEIGSREGFEVVPCKDSHWLVWDREAWDREAWDRESEP